MSPCPETSNSRRRELEVSGHGLISVRYVSEAPRSGLDSPTQGVVRPATGVERMMRIRTTAGATAAAALSLLAGARVAAPKPANPPPLPGAPVRVGDPLDPPSTHFHAPPAP